MKLGVGQRALAIAAFGLFATASASPAAADTASELRELKARLQQLEAQVAKQRAEVKRATNVANAAQAHVSKDGHGHPPPPPVFVSFKNGLFVETEDKAFSFHVGGRVHADGGWQSDPANGDASNVLLRRARLDIAGKAFKYWYYRTQFEFGGSSGSVSSANVRDAWLAFKYPLLTTVGLPYQWPVVIQLANQLRPLGLEAMSTSNSGITFIERSMMSDAFNTPRRHLGASISSGGHNWGVKAGIYSTSPQDSSIRPTNNKLGQYWEVDGRAVFLPIRTEEDLIHIGATGRYYQNNGASGASNDELLVGRGVRNEANALNTRLLGTPDMSCNPGGPFNLTGSVWAANPALGGSLVQNNCLKSSAQFNVEFVAIHGPFSIQAEYSQTSFRRDSYTSAALLITPSALTGVPAFQASRLAAGQGLQSSATFDGFYAQAQLFLTGETRITAYTDIEHNINTPYTFSTAPKILNPISKGGYGAWEVAARWSSINLDNGSQGAWSYLPAYGALGLVPGVNIPGGLFPATLAANSVGLTGGRVNKITLGLNWYPEKGYRFLFNYGRVLANVAPFNQPWLSANDTNSFLTRAEVWW
ncbi:OprO/OprP family phosphate-selective porin [Methylocystis suflitae]|uniref:OprO/OprP family phosphate-selective porin n=1 Tax=Methylocystis suflitae TaxID=2951405 RepID=UPI0021094BA4|nr:porin [Methylocystis suflitae]MCQ4188251.1 OprO/OprP family phosphate-selective porin [Methylocystis suflitae]